MYRLILPVCIISISFLLISACIISCGESAAEKIKGREEKAKELITEDLRKSLHDFKSYEVVEFSKLDSSYTRLEDDTVYNRLLDDFEFYRKEFKDYIAAAEIYLTFDQANYQKNFKLAQYAHDKEKEALDKSLKMEKEFKPAFNGWKMEHSYRAKNKSGNTILSYYNYHFDSSLSKLIKHIDISDDTYHKEVIDTLQ